ncbi:hypothetical protein [Hymenobacter sp. YC55]|uniref:hypothetical protein n=1 Tax=Hymenobacter sp. YC55 TaxID=3034019 RepID=UPI0023F7348A|nr:hypothetical protein [Hymenobacter sp. YC55]MDF7815327.1 hypothetical protein [Hymenobacter sp. YC55]
MPFYQLPRLNEAVKWLPEQPRTILRFGPNGSLVLLHATTDPALTAPVWQTQPVQLGLVGTSLEETPTEVPPVLGARLGEWPAVAAPACIFEMGDPVAIHQWLNARSVPPELRLVLLRLDLEQPSRAVVEASRRIWAPEWVAGDVLLRLRLEQQYLRTADEDAGNVQEAGRQLVATTPALQLLRRAEFTLAVAGETVPNLFGGSNPVGKQDD